MLRACNARQWTSSVWHATVREDIAHCLATAPLH